MQNQGLQELPLPHRLSLWGRTEEQISTLQQKDRPIEAPPFPLPNPLLNTGISPVQIGLAAGDLPPQLKFLKLQWMKATTDPQSRTAIADSVHKYPVSSRLRRVRTSNELWSALVGFAVGQDDDVDAGDNAPLDQGPEGQFHTYRNGSLPVPRLEEQIKPIFNLWGWFLMHLTTPSPSVNSELSVQDEIHRQLLHPMDQLIKVYAYCVPYNDGY